MKYEAFIILAIVCVGLIAGLIDFNTPRELWDERSRYMSGLSYWNNIINGKWDSDSWSINSNHPMVAKLMYGFVNGVYLYATNPSLLKSSTANLYELDMEKTMAAGHALTLFLAICIYVMVYKIGSLLANKRVGFIAALMLILSPLFAAHVRYANLDMPMTFFFVLAMYLLFKGLDTNKNKYYMGFGIAAGLAVSSLYTGGLVLIIGYVIYAVDKKTWRLPKELLLIPIIVAAIFFGSNPYLWSDPIGHLSQALGFFGSYYNAGVGAQEYFYGNLGIPPITYFVTYLFVSTPMVILIILLGTAFNQNFKLWVWLLVGLLFISMIPTRLNGTTYLVPIYPALVLLAAKGLDCFNTYKRLYIVMAVGLFAILIGTMATVHPFYMDYYNELTSHVYENKTFRVGAAGEGLDYAIDYINNNAPLNSTIEFHVAPMHVMRGFRPDIIQQNSFFSPGMVSRASNYTPDWSFKDSDYMIVNTYYEWYIGDVNTTDYDLVGTVQVKGMPLVKIYRKEGLK